jgi:hypothetical protein
MPLHFIANAQADWPMLVRIILMVGGIVGIALAIIQGDKWLDKYFERSQKREARGFPVLPRQKESELPRSDGTD